MTSVDAPPTVATAAKGASRLTTKRLTTNSTEKPRLPPFTAGASERTHTHRTAVRPSYNMPAAGRPPNYCTTHRPPPPRIRTVLTSPDAILEIPESASAQEIRDAYKRFVSP